MLKQGDRVKVEGVEADIETSWGQGKHTAYKLTDGRIVLDLNEKHLVPSLPFQVMVKNNVIDLVNDIKKKDRRF